MNKTPIGIDVSHHQGEIDWPQVAASGVAFAYAKATEGASFLDPRFDRNWDRIGRTGLLRGAYHFFRPARPVDEQAERFIDTVKRLGPGDLPPMLDLEETSAAHDEWLEVPKRRRAAAAMDWLRMVERALGRRPVVYTRRSFIERVIGDAAPLARYPLWVAHYTTAPAPAIPSGWNTWRIWQYSSRGAVTGVTGPVDLNRFNGTPEDLRALAALPPAWGEAA